MYLFNELQVLSLLLLFLLWGIGGWLLTLRCFDLEPHERGLIGLGLGLVIANWLGNFLARVLPLPLAFRPGDDARRAVGNQGRNRIGRRRRVA